MPMHVLPLEIQISVSSHFVPKIFQIYESRCLPTVPLSQRETLPFPLPCNSQIQVKVIQLPIWVVLHCSFITSHYPFIISLIVARSGPARFINCDLVMFLHICWKQLFTGSFPIVISGTPSVNVF